MNMVHGGDIYRNSVTLDFSVNVNPLGMPEGVKQALLESIEVCNQYPDIRQQELKTEVGKLHEVLPEHILFGNGASELFMAIVHALQPKKKQLYRFRLFMDMNMLQRLVRVRFFIIKCNIR